MKQTGTLCAFLVLATAGLLAGCAVLTVNVDVYKGPLANHEDVLTEQTAVLAIGAKPLLQQLHDELCGKPTEGNGKNHVNQKKVVQGVQTIACENNLDVDLKHRRQAKRVSAVLGLYEDQFGELRGLQNFVVETEQKILEFEKQIKEVNDIREDDERLLESVKGNAKDQFKGCWGGNYGPKNAQNFIEKLKKKSEAEKIAFQQCVFIYYLEKFLVPDSRAYRSAQQLVFAYSCLVSEHCKKMQQNHASPDNKIFLGPATAAYAFLAKKDNAKKLVDQLLKNPESDTSIQLSERLVEISAPFAEARKLLVDLWTDSLDFLGELYTSTKPYDQENLLELRPKVLVPLARFVAMLTDVWDVVILHNSENNGNEVRTTSDLQDKIKKYSSWSTDNWELCKFDTNCDSKANWERDREKLLRFSLENAIIAEPIEVTKLLSGINSNYQNQLKERDKWVPELPQNTARDSDANKVIYAIGYEAWSEAYGMGDYQLGNTCKGNEKMQEACSKLPEYGIVGVPNLTLLQEVIRGMEDVKKVGGLGLDAGRLPQGLNTLIEEYLRYSTKGNQEQIKESRNNLLHALVRFAEKVLVIANHDELLDIDEPDSGSREELDKYVLTLQAIGNAIIVQVDDLVRREQRQDKLNAAAEKVNSVRNRDTYKYTDQRDVFDQLIAELRYSLVKFEGNGDIKEAERLRQTIQTALNQRSALAYIRPSSAYLRSSYAGTGLQSDPGLAWSNRLIKHSRRALSVSQSGNGKTNDNVIAEIDKQFWQNINKVRVAGGGKVNYVLAKDDVGNWYVKSYQTSREGIFKSATNLALFSAGSKFDLNLIERMELEQEFKVQGSSMDSAKKKRLDELRQQQTDAGAPEVLSDLYEKFKTQYGDSVTSIHMNMMLAIAPTGSDPTGTRLGSRIVEAWGRQNHAVFENINSSDFEAVLKPQLDAIHEHYKEMSELVSTENVTDDKVQKMSEQIINSLILIDRFNASTLEAIDMAFSGEIEIAKTNVRNTEEEYTSAKFKREALQSKLIDNPDNDSDLADLGNQIEKAEKTESDLEEKMNTAKTLLNSLLHEEKAAKSMIAGIAASLFVETLTTHQLATSEYERALIQIGSISSE